MADANRIQGRERTDAQSEHPNESLSEPLYSPFERALRTVITPSYGYRAKLLDLFERRAGLTLIQAWRNGRAKPPQWALDILAKAIEHQSTQGRRALAQCPVAVPAGIRGATVLATWRASQARLRDAQKEKAGD